jgi:hypothetical protein
MEVLIVSLSPFQETLFYKIFEERMVNQNVAVYSNGIYSLCIVQSSLPLQYDVAFLAFAGSSSHTQLLRPEELYHYCENLVIFQIDFYILVLN